MFQKFVDGKIFKEIITISNALNWSKVKVKTGIYKKY